MVIISSTYLGELRCSASHGPSASTLLTDAPTDNQGKGQAFSPTDLVATALGTCMLTTMAIVARRSGLELKGSSVHVEKHMAQLPVRRIAKIVLHFSMTGVSDATMRVRLENAAHACPVHHSLHPEVEYSVRFDWNS